MESFKKARENMIEQQIRPWSVTEPTILDLMRDMPREAFVPKGMESVAYTDTDIPLVDGHHMMAPKVVARMLQALAIKPSDKILEIGTGTGYMTALLSKLGSQVTSIDINEQCFAMAKDNLASGYPNVSLEHGDGCFGLAKHAPFDVIVVNGSYPTRVPSELLEQLNHQGRIGAIVGQEPCMCAVILTKHGQSIEQEKLFEVLSTPLVNAPTPSAFTF